MDLIKEAIIEWLKEILVDGIISNLSGLFDSVNEKVADVAGQVGQTPEAWNGTVFNMVRSLSENVILPIAGVILAIVMTIELIQMVTEKNNMHGDIDTFMFFKWIFKTAAAVLIVTNTWNIVMGIFEVAQSVVNNAAGVINANAALDISSIVTDLETRLMAMDVGALFGLWFQTLFVHITMWALTVCIFIVVFGRMIEIYVVTSVAPIPMATMLNHEWGQMGQNYLRSLFALAFQAFLIILCVGIYAALINNIVVSDDISYAIWTCMGYTVLLCFSLFKTGSIAKTVFNAH
ncbi:MAG: CD0415/CD1112 family protein [Oscillospiraceae bacterium]|nr:CD0415/CD1112 family protein [Oscillospiraceae bacterium]